MKLSLLTTPLLLLALGGQTIYSFAQVTPSNQPTYTTTARKKIFLKYSLPSEVTSMIKESKQKRNGLMKGIVELTPKDSYKAIIVRGTPEAITTMEQVCAMLDAKPFAARITLRLFQVERTEDGAEKETLYKESVVTARNNACGELDFNEASPIAKIVMIPHINGDKSLSLGIAVDFSRGIGSEAKCVASAMTRRINKPDEWITVGALTTDQVFLSSLPTEAVAHNPLYRLDASYSLIK